MQDNTPGDIDAGHGNDHGHGFAAAGAAGPDVHPQERLPLKRASFGAKQRCKAAKLHIRWPACVVEQLQHHFLSLISCETSQQLKVADVTWQESCWVMQSGLNFVGLTKRRTAFWTASQNISRGPDAMLGAPMTPEDLAWR
jgi:hypothetical protein